ncbi:hypothetical protein XENTR_v10002263 [Xenopus tropicalis]|nr:hypothetical protein XENTR_v10002263 [Xenopus tropicalis]
MCSTTQKRQTRPYETTQAKACCTSCVYNQRQLYNTALHLQLTHGWQRKLEALHSNLSNKPWLTLTTLKADLLQIK